MRESRMRFLTFTDREAWRMIVLSLLVPVLGLALIVVSALLRRWIPSVRPVR
jgi:hypothetical protein